MKIYLLEQNINKSYYACLSFVVIAKSEEEARKIKPDSTPDSWVEEELVTVTEIGTANKYQEEGYIVISSYQSP